MDGWIDCQIGWMDEQIGWMDGQTDQMDAWMYTDRQTDRQGQMEKWMAGELESRRLLARSTSLYNCPHMYCVTCAADST